MNQSSWLGLSLGITLFVASHAAADGSMVFSLAEVDRAAQAPEQVAAPASTASTGPVSRALGELHWGMSKADLLRLLKSRIQAEFQARVKVERDVVRQDALYQEAKERYQHVTNSFIAFDAHKNGWDVSPIADEFRRGSDESMLVIDDHAARDYYFFIRGHLWKWYRELKPEADMGDYDQVAELLRGQFGTERARDKQPQQAGPEREGPSWSDQSTRVTLMRRGTETCMVFEALAVLDQLAQLRKDALSTAPRSNAALEAIVLTDAQREAWKRDDPRATGANGQRAPSTAR